MSIARTVLTVTAALILTPAWSTQLSTAGIKSCAGIADNNERLTCFDREVAVLNAADARSPAAAVAQPPKLSAEQKLGLPQYKVEKLEAAPGGTAVPLPKVQGLAARIAGSSVNAAGRQVFTLDNGQVWQQADSSRALTVHEGDEVQIARGALGAFFLSVNKHSSLRVSRLH